MDFLFFSTGGISTSMYTHMFAMLIGLISVHCPFFPSRTATGCSVPSLHRLFLSQDSACLASTDCLFLVPKVTVSPCLIFSLHPARWLAWISATTDSPTERTGSPNGRMTATLMSSLCAKRAFCWGCCDDFGYLRPDHSAG